MKSSKAIAGRYLGYHAADAAQPFARFFNPRMAPVAPHVCAALDRGGVPAPLLPGFEDAAENLFGGGAVLEDGFVLTPDGGMRVSVRTESPLGEWVTHVDAHNGDVLWRFGRNAKRNEFTIYGDSRGFSHQHDARRLPNGRLLLYDNGNCLNPRYARAMEYTLDEENLAATLVWQYWHWPLLARRRRPPFQASRSG